MTTGTILAVKPGSREVGYALFQGGVLTIYDVKSLRRSASAESRPVVLRRLLGALLANEQPGVVALAGPRTADTNRYLMLAQVVDAIRAGAASHGVPVREFTPEAIAKAVTDDPGATKRMVATSICGRFPALHGYLERHNGREEWHALRLFDAIACGLACLQASQSNLLTGHAPTPETI